MLRGNLRPYFKTNNKKNDKKKPWYEWKRISFMCNLLIFISRSFSYEFGNLLNYFWGNDLSFFSLLIKLFGHFNLSILRISSHFKWEFSWISKMWWFSLVFCVGQIRHQKFHWVEDLLVVFFLVEVKYRAEISLEIAKIG